MASAEDVETQELNFIFKSLGKREPHEAELYESLKDLMGNVSKDMSMMSENQVMAQIYGSTAEDLKSRRGEFRFGDFDIMAFPTSDNLMIRDELIEYLPENPMHVRIIGADHPVLQSCLVEGTEYVATSTLKNFHPAIYGSVGSLLTACLQLVSRLEDINSILRRSLPLTIQPKNNESSPALTISFLANLFSSTPEQFKGMSSSQNVDKTKSNIESKSKHDGGRMESCLEDEFMQFCVLPEICHEVESERNTKGNFMPTSGYGDQASAANVRQPAATKESLGNCYQVRGKTMSKQVIELRIDEDHKSDKNDNEDLDGNQNQPETEEQFFAKGEPVMECKQTNPFEIDQSLNAFFEHKLEKKTETKTANFKESGISEPCTQSLLGIDFVPAFRSQEWPKVASEWKELRDRKWPSLEIVDRVIQGGFHLVVKPSKMSGNPDCDFRISFSHAEYLLSKEMNDIQRECYRCLKAFHRAFLSTEPKGLVTYHLKNILLATIEETGAEMWTESNRAECMTKLFGKLLHALRMKDLRHFFVRSCNLLCDDYIENPEMLESLVGRVEQIMKNPLEFSKQLIQEQFDEKECDVMPSLQAFIEQFLENENTYFSSCRGYDESKDSFLNTCNELIDMAVNQADCSLEDLDPLERSIVEDIRDMKKTKEELYKVFEETFESVFWKVLMSTEPNTRRGMLDGIKTAVELSKYRLQHTLDAQAADEEFLARKIFDPNDCLHWSQFLPAASGPPLIRSPMPKAAEPQHFGMDDIPLD